MPATLSPRPNLCTRLRWAAAHATTKHERDLFREACLVIEACQRDDDARRYGNLVAVTTLLCGLLVLAVGMVAGGVL